MVIATRAKERSARAHALHHVKAEQVMIERDCPIQISDLEVDVADPYLRVDGIVSRHLLRLTAQPRFHLTPVTSN